MAIAASTATLATLVLAAPASATSSDFNAQSANTIVEHARAAMAEAGSVSASGHGFGTASGGGKVEIRESDYTGATSGTQQLEITSTDGSGVNLPAASTVVVDGRVYVDADAEFWTTSAGLSNTQAAAAANRWVQIPSTNPFYALAAADLTMPSLISDIFSAKKFHKGRIVSVDGVRAIPIMYTNTGNDSGPAICDVALGGNHLPVAVTIDGITLHLTLWGRTKAVTAPVGALLLPSTSSGGETTT